MMTSGLIPKPQSLSPYLIIGTFTELNLGEMLVSGK